jgi:hypothetical protein
VSDKLYNTAGKNCLDKCIAVQVLVLLLSKGLAILGHLRFEHNHC